MVEGFFGGICVVAVAILIFAMGSCTKQDISKADCDRFGATAFGKAVYECKARQ